MHVDTTSKFREMTQLRDQRAAKLALDLTVHQNDEGMRRGIKPFDHGAAAHTVIMKTRNLKQALDQCKFDAALDAARRAEAKSRAKERVFWGRTAGSVVHGIAQARSRDGVSTSATAC